MRLDSADHVGGLLSKPTELRDMDSVLDRALCDYEDRSRRFLHGANKDFSKQFFHVYAHRLSAMKDMLLRRINQKWGTEIPVLRLADLKEETSERCIIIGTLYKHQELKPSILKEISEEHQLVPQPSRSEFASDGDQLILEDELQRIRLVGTLNVHEVITGVVCAVLGSEKEGGRFEVEDYCFPSPCEPERPLCPVKEERYLILVSGLNLAGSPEVLPPLQLMTDWVSGWLGDLDEQRKQALSARILFAGNSIRVQSPNRGSSLHNVSDSLDQVNTLDAVKLFDDFLLQLVSNIPVDVMPGEHDPTNCSLPQQPMHSCMFPQSAAYRTFHCIPNPCEFIVGGRHVMGSAGQPVNDICSFSRLSNRIDILERSLQWGHLAPSAPDTLCCYPYSEDDPLIIKELPDIYFAGNQPEFQTKLFKDVDDKEVRLICIPKFTDSKSVVVVNLATLDCQCVSFGDLSLEDSMACDVEK